MDDPPVRPVSSYRVLTGDRGSALLGPLGEVDWWCAPEVDSRPVLWSLLDPRGAAARWCGVRLVARSEEPAARTAWTVLRHGRARVECRDALLGPALVRLVRAVDGPLELTHELAVGGFDGAWGTWEAGRARLDDGTTVRVAAGLPAGVRDDGRCLRTVLRAAPGEWAALVVAVGGEGPEPDAEALLARVAAREREAGAGRAPTRLPRHHPERAADALAVLEACTYQPTGAVVAALTTSLPEAPGADRQFDYRYTWLRDASLAVSVASLLGHRRTAVRYLHFIHSISGEDGIPTAPFTTVRGEPAPEEREVDGVAGRADSRPVRVGNAAADQHQFDTLGMLVEAVSVYLQTGGKLDDRTWRLVGRVADHVCDDDRRVESGIWELRRPRLLVSGDIGRWLALDRALWIARGWRPYAALDRRHRWRRARRAYRDRVLAALTPAGGLPQSYDDDPPEPDGAALLAVVFGMLHGHRDPRAARLVDATIADLEAGPFLHRYEPGGDDGFTGSEGAFLPVSWWAVSALAAVGRVDQARARADAMCRVLPRLLAEEVDPATGESLGNVPLVWSHMELARALYVLDAAALRRRFGAAGLWAWRLTRYVRLLRAGGGDGAGGAGGDGGDAGDGGVR